MIDLEPDFAADVVADGPARTYKSLEARVAPSIDPSVDVDVACFMTTDTVDADDEVVLPSGADLSRFEKNPVLMLCHAHGQPGSYYPLPVGKVIWTKRRPNGVMAGIAFARNSQLGREVKALFDEDMLRSFSIGFRSLESSPMTRNEAYSRPDWRAAYERAAGRILVHRKWLLLELSVAPIPSNENALRVAYKSKGRSIPGWLKIKGDDMASVDERRPDDAIKAGDHCLFTKHGGGCGTVKSIQRSGSFPEDSHNDDTGVVEASKEAPVALVAVHDDDHAETERKCHLKCQDLRRLHGPVTEKCAAEESATSGGYTTAPHDKAEEDDVVEASIQPNDFVKISAPHHKGYGQVKSIHQDGFVPDVDEDVRGTRKEPAARVKCFKTMGDGHAPTDEHLGCKCKHLTKCAPLKPPSKNKSRILSHHELLPPLVGKTDAELVEEAITKLNRLLTSDSIQRMVADELDHRMGYV